MSCPVGIGREELTKMHTRTIRTVGLAALATLFLAACGSVGAQTTEERWSDRIGGWSPDGKLVVFLSNRPDQQQWDLYVASADGRRPRRLTDDALVERYAVFLTNRTVGFTLRDGAYGLSLDGRERRKLQRETTQLPVQTTVYYGEAPDIYVKAFSPDHRWIAYSGKGSSFTVTTPCDCTQEVAETDVWLKRSNGSGRRLLFQDVAEFDGAQWSPDGRWVAFDTVAGLGRQVYVVRVPSGKPRRLSHDAVSCCPRWTRDGRELLYEGPEGSFVLVRPNGTGEHALPHDIRVRRLVVSPDETKAFFEERDGYVSTVGILDLASGESRRLRGD
jgi:Tol biopolymer transport system component